MTGWVVGDCFVSYGESEEIAHQLQIRIVMRTAHAGRLLRQPHFAIRGFNPPNQLIEAPRPFSSQSRQDPTLCLPRARRQSAERSFIAVAQCPERQSCKRAIEGLFLATEIGQALLGLTPIFGVEGFAKQLAADAQVGKVSTRWRVTI